MTIVECFSVEFVLSKLFDFFCTIGLIFGSFLILECFQTFLRHYVVIGYYVIAEYNVTQFKTSLKIFHKIVQFLFVVVWCQFQQYNHDQKVELDVFPCKVDCNHLTYHHQHPNQKQIFVHFVFSLFSSSLPVPNIDLKLSSQKSKVDKNRQSFEMKVDGLKTEGTSTLGQTVVYFDSRQLILECATFNFLGPFEVSPHWTVSFRIKDDIT